VYSIQPYVINVSVSCGW